MNDIDSIKGYQPPSEGGGLWLKLADGEEVKVRITSLPVIFENEFKMGEEINLSTRFGFIVWNHEVNKAQIWVTNAATYSQQLSPILEDDEYGDWREYDVKIKRTGEKAQTRYHVRPGVKRYGLTNEQLAQCDKVDIIAVIKKSDNASKVMWLSEYRELEEQAKQGSGIEKARATASKIRNKPVAISANEGGEDDETGDIGDEEVDLNSIPF